MNTKNYKIALFQKWFSSLLLKCRCSAVTFHIDPFVGHPLQHHLKILHRPSLQPPYVGILAAARGKSFDGADDEIFKI